jgi:GTP cyclohydrolase III
MTLFPYTTLFRSVDEILTGVSVEMIETSGSTPIEATREAGQSARRE